MYKKIQIDNVVYQANVDFRVAIECNRIAEDKTIGDFERSLAIIYMVYGEAGLENKNHYDKLLKWILNYFSCGKKIEQSNETPDMDFIEDMDYIEASFMSDYHIDLENTQMDWQKFYKLLNGLSDSEMGNCCILNRIRNLRNFNLKDIKDVKEREKIREAQKRFALKRNQKVKEPTKEQKKRSEELYRKLGLRKE